MVAPTPKLLAVEEADWQTTAKKCPKCECAMELESATDRRSWRELSAQIAKSESPQSKDEDKLRGLDIGRNEVIRTATIGRMGRWHMTGKHASRMSRMSRMLRMLRMLL